MAAATLAVDTTPGFRRAGPPAIREFVTKRVRQTVAARGYTPACRRRLPCGARSGTRGALAHCAPNAFSWSHRFIGPGGIRC